MKRTKKLLAVLPFLFMMAGCGEKDAKSKEKTTSNTVITTNNKSVQTDVRYQIYLSAVSAGYDGNYEAWLESIKGDSIQLKVENNYVKFKYSQATEWVNLISLDALKGDNGATGKNSKLQVANGYIQWQNEGDETWNNLIALDDLKGVDGNSKKTDMRVDNGYIQWKYEDATTWNDLLDLSTLKGANGKNAIMQVDGDYIQWKVEGTDTWIDIIEVASLKGEKGDTGKQVSLTVADGFIKWQNEGDTSWNELISIDSLKGATGSAGKKSLMRNNGTYIQWQNEGDGDEDEDWNNLIAIADLKGDTGDDGDEVELREENGIIQWKYSSASEWTTLYDLNVETFTVSFNLNGAEGSIDNQTIKFGYKATRPEEPTRKGLVFEGWYYKGEKWSFVGYSVTEDMELVAKWVELPSDIKKFVYEVDDNGFYVIDGYKNDFANAELENVVLPANISQTKFCHIEQTNATKVKNLYYNGTIEDWCGITIGQEFYNPMYGVENVFFLDEEGIYTYNGLTYSKLELIVIPEGVETIGSYQFYGSPNAYLVTIPQTVTSIGNNPFACPNIEEIYVDDRNTVYTSGNLLHAIIEINTNTIVTGCKNTNLADCNATIIGYDAFNLSKINGIITIPNGIGTIEAGAFAQCNNLRIVIFPSSLKKIDGSAFVACESLEEVRFAEGLETIGEYAFGLNPKLTAFTLPTTLKTVWNYTFADCTNLKYVYILEGLTTIPQGMFNNCSAIEFIVLPNSISSIGDDAFKDAIATNGVIYFHGTEAKWDSLDKTQNDSLTSHKVYYYSENYPEDFVADKYWRYVDDYPTVWVQE